MNYEDEWDRIAGLNDSDEKQRWLEDHGRAAREHFASTEKFSLAKDVLAANTRLPEALKAGFLLQLERMEVDARKRELSSIKDSISLLIAQERADEARALAQGSGTQFPQPVDELKLHLIRTRVGHFVQRQGFAAGQTFIQAHVSELSESIRESLLLEILADEVKRLVGNAQGGEAADLITRTEISQCARETLKGRIVVWQKEAAARKASQEFYRKLRLREQNAAQQAEWAEIDRRRNARIARGGDPYGNSEKGASSPDNRDPGYGIEDPDAS
ncbi:MAG: hypothetical protein A2V88_04855 [Elusimicrobia bacterium RBG_16_66_12]|nr:MAG: hypothetical protein A2V88_04855 [Elusimicrobia bacterium RBG_16_66_12]